MVVNKVIFFLLLYPKPVTTFSFTRFLIDLISKLICMFQSNDDLLMWMLIKRRTYSKGIQGVLLVCLWIYPTGILLRNIESIKIDIIFFLFSLRILQDIIRSDWLKSLWFFRSSSLMEISITIWFITLTLTLTHTRNT